MTSLLNDDELASLISLVSTEPNSKPTGKPPFVQWPDTNPDKPQNLHHRETAEAIVKAYSAYTGSEYDPAADPADNCAIRDLMADLIHLCDHIDLDPDQEFTRAMSAFYGDCDEPMTMSGEWLGETEE